MKEDNTMFYQAIGNSIQANKDKIEKLEKQNERLKKKNKFLQSQLKAKKEENKRYRELGFKYLNDQNDKLKEVIKEARENVEKLGHSDWVSFGRSILLEILSKGENK